MRKIKRAVFTFLALFPLLVYLLALVRTGDVTSFTGMMATVLGSFGEFFSPLIEPLLTSFVPLADPTGVSVFVWLIGYYVTLLLVWIVFSLFTFLITLFTDKVESMRGGR